MAHFQHMDYFHRTKINFKEPQGPWKKVFAWTPKIIKGKFFWLTNVYIRERNRYIYPSQGYEYGTEFDVLRDN